MSNSQVVPTLNDNGLGLHGENAKNSRSKGAMIWYHNLPPNSIDSFSMLADSFVKAHAGAIKVATRKSDLFKVRQNDKEMLGEFISRFQMERMDFPPVTDNWDVQAFTQGLNERSFIATPVDRVKRNVDREPRSNRDRYQPYGRDQRNNEFGHNLVWNDRRNDRGQSSRGLVSKSGFNRDAGSNESPQLSEYNFSIDVSAIVSAIGRIKDTRWPRPLKTDTAQRNPNKICKYHGTHDHKIEDYRQLREEVARLFNEGNLREFLSDRAKNHFKNRDSNRQNE
ncbi:PREDICTED: uncharacterized protein LOC109233656 [Nicotiana attenuata]|uniref:uncharacterized protein LOC109233656 n=1 Tax=Nicotiana attenuata TaxID=49451 RepID=UPI000904E00E|nr:PREDICTED: uncharacterized protein LOC109233656 [Nicotiana attenuata]